MLKRKDVQHTHLAKILKERGPLTAESLRKTMEHVEREQTVGEAFSALRGEEQTAWREYAKRVAK